MSSPITSKKTSKHRIEHPKDPNSPLTGVLEQVAPDEPTQGRRIALLLHGSIGHKDYLFLKRVALRLPIDSFRFDFRGNFESPGPWRMAGFDDDAEDISAVVAYLTSKFGYVVDLIVAHSRGVVAAIRWMCTAQEAQSVRGFVNASGRYRMDLIYDSHKSFLEDLEKHGHFIRNETVARQPWSAKIMKKDMEEFANFDSSLVWDYFPKKTHVLTLHGLKDAVVPAYDGIIYSRAFAARSPGTHQLYLIEEADHNFTRMQDHVTDTILEWFALMESGTLTTGIWHTGIREPSQVRSSRL
ncbi:ectomycorrhiza-regulated esterase [Irpex rosettiformis]|uniref:Ectomycorrhiza-regulated esterase n=1 Tax=Irpex rosettiformis TaxID=378272 RepID=A0ACB8TWU1_9APHY|nr:ectomycorrhiza-regulated esterase [Irpex rosettiformis]